MEFISKFDSLVFDLMEKISCVVLDWFFKIISYTGDKGIVWIVAGIIFLLNKKTKKIGLCVILSLLCAVIINNFIIKEIFDRTRPFIADPTINLIIKAPVDSSFPSGHTATSFASAVSIFFFDRKKGAIALVYATFVGLSRIYLHVHYATDVIAGVIIGVIIARCIAVLLERVYEKIYKMINGEA